MGWMAFGWIFILLVVVGVWYAVSATRRGDSKEESPENILKRRYTNGEIDRDTYERISM